MAKKKERKYGSEKVAAAGGIVGGFAQAAQSQNVNIPIKKGNKIFNRKIKVPKGKAGIALFGLSAGLSIGADIQAVREANSFGEGLGKLFITNPLSRIVGRTIGLGAGKGALKGVKKLKKKSSAFAAKKASAKATGGAKMKDVTPKNVVFRRIGRRIIPIRRKSRG